MSFTTKELTEQMLALGLRKGDCVVTHAAFKKIGETDRGAATLIDAIIETVLPGGAVLFPNLNIPHGFTAENPPRFDVKKDSIRRTIGIVPDVFKFEYAEAFSLHPTHSMSGAGEKAGEILKDHEKAGVPCGPGTPWHKNALAGGKILLIGVNQHSNTTYHCAEECLADSYRLTPDFIDGIVLIDGREITVRSRLHVWEHPADFNIINPELEARGFLRKGFIGNAPTMCLDAAGFLETCAEKLSADRSYFLRSRT